MNDTTDLVAPWADLSDLLDVLERAADKARAREAEPFQRGAAAAYEHAASALSALLSTYDAEPTGR